MNGSERDLERYSYLKAPCPTHFTGHLNSNWLDDTIDLLLRSQLAILQCFIDFKHAAKTIVNSERFTAGI